MIDCPFHAADKLREALILQKFIAIYITHKLSLSKKKRKEMIKDLFFYK